MNSKTLRTIFQICLGVLCLTALWGAGISVRREYAFAWLACFCISYALLLALRNIRDSGGLEWVILISVALSVAYLVNRDWWSREGWIAAMTPLYRGLSKFHAPMDLIYAHSADGAMLALVPLQIAAVRVRRDAGKIVWPWTINSVFALVMLIVGASKGTLLLLPAAVAAGMWGVGLLSLRTFRRISSLHLRWGAAALCVLLSGPFVHFVSVERPWLSTSFQFALDYWLTGVGVGNFPLAYSLYRAILPTPYLSHAQNLFLDVWLTHGAVGLIAFLGVCATACAIGVRALRFERGIDAAWRTAALGSLAIVLVQGLFDDPYYDGGHVLPVLALVLAITVRDVVQKESFLLYAQKLHRTTLLSRFPGCRINLYALFFFLPFSLATIPAARAAVFANIGALLQMRVDLRAVGDAPANDVTRRDASFALASAMRFYEYALVLDSHNALAHLRLGQIALIRRELDAAHVHLEAAWRANPYGRAENLLLGEVLWRQGNAAEADVLWRSVGQWELSIDTRMSQ